jgi:hypothetical protein
LKLPDGSLLSGGSRPETDTYTLTCELPLEQVTALRLEVLADDSLPQRGPGRQDNGNLHLSELEIYIVEATETAVPIGRAAADFNQADWDIARAIDGVPQTAWGIYPQVGQSHEAVFEFKQPIKSAATRRIKVVLKQLHGGGHLIGRLRLSVTDAPLPVGIDLLPQEVRAILAISHAERTTNRAGGTSGADLGLCGRQSI